MKGRSSSSGSHTGWEQEPWELFAGGGRPGYKGCCSEGEEETVFLKGSLCRKPALSEGKREPSEVSTGGSDVMLRSKVHFLTLYNYNFKRIKRALKLNVTGRLLNNWIHLKYLCNTVLCINYLLFSRKVMSDSLRLHGLQHTRPLCPALSPGVCSSSCPLSQWWYLTISFSASLFSFCLQSSPASRSFPILYIYMCVCVCVYQLYIKEKLAELFRCVYLSWPSAIIPTVILHLTSLVQLSYSFSWCSLSCTSLT